MASNQTVLVGNITADPELRYTREGMAVANFSVAHTPRRLVGGEWEDGDVIFLRCTVWRDYAEHVAASLTKGAQVIVVGELIADNYEKDDGTTVYGYNLSVTEIGPALRFVVTTSAKAVAEKPVTKPAPAKPRR